MGEFDLSLIREFRSRPAFYDRNSPLFKDKVFTAREWQLIANKLGYDVSLLKDRMLQLRNRYNLEKRRLEQLREENVGQLIESPWPLYGQLHFLSEHIRTRRSYKRMLPMQNASLTIATSPEEHSYSGSEQMPTLAAASSFPNGMVSVKMEEGECCDLREDDTSTESVGQSLKPSHVPGISKDRNRLAAALPMPELSRAHSHLSYEQTRDSSVQVPPSITIRRLDTMRGPSPLPSSQSEQLTTAITVGQAPQPPFTKQATGVNTDQRGTTANVSTDLQMVMTTKHLNVRQQKYAAFGSFISSSLLELPPQKSLRLVDKFTSELVNVMIGTSSVRTDSVTPRATTLCGTTINGQ